MHRTIRAIIPRRMFEIAVPTRAAIGAKIVARETISPMRKIVPRGARGRPTGAVSR